MKRKLIPAAVCMIIAASVAVLFSYDGKYIGKTAEINAGKKEVIVNVKSGTLLKMGDLLQIETDGGKVHSEFCPFVKKFQNPIRAMCCLY